MPDRGRSNIETVLATLEEPGNSGFTQVRVVAGVGPRRSHPSCYCPTCVDLLAAVGWAASDRLLAVSEATVEHDWRLVRSRLARQLGGWDG